MWIHYKTESLELSIVQSAVVLVCVHNSDCLTTIYICYSTLNSSVHKSVLIDAEITEPRRLEKKRDIEGLRLKEVLETCRGIGSHFHPSGK